MLVSPDETRLVTLVWAWPERRTLLRVFDIADGTANDIDVSPGEPVDLVPGEEGYFAVRQRNAPNALALSAYVFSDPSVPRTQVFLSRDNGAVRIDGDPSALTRLPRVIALTFPWLLRIDDGRIQLHRLGVRLPSAANVENPAVAIPCPDGRTVVVTTERHVAELLVYDLATTDLKAEFLLGYGYAPKLRFRDRGRDLWVAHYDTIHRIDTDSWSVVNGVRLRNDKSGSFIADLSFDPTEGRCAVSYALRRLRRYPGLQYPLADPAGGRVLVFDVDSFTVTHHARGDGWINEVVLLSDDRVLGRILPQEVWLSALAPARFRLYPPRSADDRDWS